MTTRTEEFRVIYRMKQTFPYLVCAIFFLVFTALLFALPAYKYDHFGKLPDILIFYDSFVSAAQGELFTNHRHYWQQIDTATTAMVAGKTASMFGMHFRPTLFLLLPFFKLWPTVYCLLLIQACVVSSAFLPIYFLLRKKLRSQILGLAGTLIFFFHPILMGSSTSFFPSYLAIGFLAWGFYFLHNNHDKSFIVCLLLTLFLKELMAIPVILAGLYYGVIRSKKTGIAICLIGAVYLYGCTEFIIPHFALTEKYNFADSYGQSHGTVYAVITGLLLSPSTLADIFFREEVFVYLANILLPLFMLPLFSSSFLLTLPLFFQNIFASAVPHSLFTTGHLSAPILPFLFLAFFHGTDKLVKNLSKMVIAFLFCLSAVTSLVFSVTILLEMKYSDLELMRLYNSVSADIGYGQIVSTNINDVFATHLVGRNRLARFPEYSDAHWVIAAYDNALCGQDLGKIPAAEKFRSELSEASQKICVMLNDPCTVSYYNETYMVNKSVKYSHGMDPRLVALRNTCLDD